MSVPITDRALVAASQIVADGLRDPARRPSVQSFFDTATNTISHVVRDPSSTACAIIDSVLDFDVASGRTATASAEKLIDCVREQQLTVDWLLETHVHADHLSAAPLLQQALGGKLAIGSDVKRVESLFEHLLDGAADPQRDGRAFDHLFVDGERFQIGNLDAIALHVPGHTPACMAYVIGDAVFPGDTLFMPDFGTARCDFPGGDAAMLYRSIQRLLQLPDATRVFLCHDYKAAGRDHYAWETTIGSERNDNVHVHVGIHEASFVAMREARDATLPVPKLLLPSVQVNLRGGRLPEPAANGIRYLKLPIDAL